MSEWDFSMTVDAAALMLRMLLRLGMLQDSSATRLVQVGRHGLGQSLVTGENQRYSLQHLMPPVICGEADSMGTSRFWAVR